MRSPRMVRNRGPRRKRPRGTRRASGIGARLKPPPLSRPVGRRGYPRCRPFPRRLPAERDQGFGPKINFLFPDPLGLAAYAEWVERTKGVAGGRECFLESAALNRSHAFKVGPCMQTIRGGPGRSRLPARSTAIHHFPDGGCSGLVQRPESGRALSGGRHPRSRPRESLQLGERVGGLLELGINL